jgi:RNA polymerase sigma-70 factor (ECF subfamily)
MSEPEHHELRSLLFSIAYRMIGSVAEAEDIVQEAFARFHEASPDAASPKAYLATITTRLAIDHLRSARAQREVYPGPWVPEPIVEPYAGGGPSKPKTPEENIEMAESLSLAFLMLLEKLTPVERAVFLLREVFAYDFAEIASIVERSEDNCRQILVRARAHVDAARPRFDASFEQREQLARRFFAACRDGDAAALAQLLAKDIVVYGDGGGKRRSSPIPIEGHERVVRSLLLFIQQAADAGLRAERACVNGQPGAVFFDGAGTVYWVTSLDIVDGAIVAIRSVLNPDKLGHVRAPGIASDSGA